MTAHWLTVRNEAEAAEILVSGTIGKDWWSDDGVSEKEFRDALSQFPKDRQVTIGINSQGGNVQDGLGIYHAIKQRGNTVARIDGYALSIASVVALAADRVISPRGSIWMIHEPWSVAQGNAEDMRRAARMLDKHGEELAGIYAAETGQPVDTAREAMKKETWFTGEEALSWGLSDEATDAPATLNKLTKNFARAPKEVSEIDHQIFALSHAPFNQISAAAGAVADGGVTASASGTNNKQKDSSPMTTLLALLAEAHIIPSAQLEDKPTADFVRDWLTKNAETLAARDQRIKELESIVETNRKAHAENIVAGAVKDGRIKDDATLRQRWVDALLADEAGALTMLGGIEKPKPADGLSAEEIAKVEAAKAAKNDEKPVGRERVIAAFQAQAMKLLGKKN
jgi:ATP-dependent Clp protease, protease subunit